jgi:hypothetical protein
MAFRFAVAGGREVAAAAPAAAPAGGPLAAPLLVPGACAGLAARWTPGYLRAAVQDGLALRVDRARRDAGLAAGIFPDTADERAALGVEELEMTFQDVLDVAARGVGVSRAGAAPPAPAPAATPPCRRCCAPREDPAAAACGVCGARAGPDRGVLLPADPPAGRLDPAQHVVYLQQQAWPFRVLFPQLLADLAALPAPCVRARLPGATAHVMWLGTGLARSQLHKDRKDNVICQVVGSKTIAVWPPAAEPALYPRPDTDGTHFQDRFSQIPLHCPAAAIADRYY